MGAMLALAPALIGAGGSIAGLMGGAPANNVQLPNMFQMPGMGNAANGAMASIGNMSSMPNYAYNLLPGFNQSAQNILSNPGASGMIAGAQGAAGLGVGAAANDVGMGNFLQSMGAGLAPYAGQILQTGFDPQNALYDRTAQRVTDQSRASSAARGLGDSPFAAGLENQSMSNFNIDWQNNLLNRMTTAGQGASGLLDQSGRDMMNAGNLFGQAPGMLQQSSMFPYMAFNQMGGDQFSALNQLSQAGTNTYAQPQQQFQNFLSYLGAGNQAGGVANQTGQLGLNQANMGFQQNQQLGQGLGNSLAMLGRGMGGGGGGSQGWGGGGGNSFFPSQSFMNNSWGY